MNRLAGFFSFNSKSTLFRIYRVGAWKIGAETSERLSRRRRLEKGIIGGQKI